MIEPVENQPEEVSMVVKLLGVRPSAIEPSGDLRPLQQGGLVSFLGDRMVEVIVLAVSEILQQFLALCWDSSRWTPRCS